MDHGYGSHIYEYLFFKNCYGKVIKSVKCFVHKKFYLTHVGQQKQATLAKKGESKLSN